MAAPRIELHPSTPWVLRLFDGLPGNAFWAGIVIGAAVFAVFLGYTALFSERPGLLGALAFGGSWAAEAVQDLFFGFTLAIAAASARGALRDLDALAPALGARGAELAVRRREVLPWRPELVWPIAIGFGLFSAIATPSDSTLWAGGRFPGWMHPAVIWLALRNFANWWAVGFAMAFELVLARAFSRLADHLRELDLLDRTALAPFGQRAVRNVSRWMLLAAFLSTTYAGRGWAGELLPLALLILTAFAVAAFLLPLAGVRGRLRGRKLEELAKARAAIRAAREKASDGSDAPPGRLADLITWEQRVEAVREWPIEASTLARLLLYVSIGLGSWVGAAVVEKLLALVLR